MYSSRVLQASPAPLPAQQAEENKLLGYLGGCYSVAINEDDLYVVAAARRPKSLRSISVNTSRIDPSRKRRLLGGPLIGPAHTYELDYHLQGTSPV